MSRILLVQLSRWRRLSDSQRLAGFFEVSASGASAARMAQGESLTTDVDLDVPLSYLRYDALRRTSMCERLESIANYWIRPEVDVSAASRW